MMRALPGLALFAALLLAASGCIQVQIQPGAASPDTGHPGSAQPTRAPSSTARPSATQHPSPTTGSHPSAVAPGPSQRPGPTANATAAPSAGFDDRAAPRPALVAPTPLAPVMLGAGDGEPNIAIAPDGTVYVTPISQLYRSRDHGKSFQALGTGKTDGHGDGDTAVDGGGRLYWLGLFGTPGPVPFMFSDDHGDTWSTPVDLSDGKGSDRQWIDATPNGTLYTSWRDSRGLVTRTSFDRGTSWAPAVVATTDTLGGPILHDPVRPHRVYIPYTQSGIFVLVSDDDGQSWSSRTVSGSLPNGVVAIQPTSIFPVVAADTGGSLYVVWAVSNPDPLATAKPVMRQAIYFAASTDGGTTWSAPRIVSDPAQDARMPWIVAGKPGRVAIAWYESVFGMPGELVPDEWNVKMWESVTADAAEPESKVVTLTTSPNHIGPVCTNGLLCVAGGDRSLLDFFELALDPQGQPVGTWATSILGTGVGVAVQGTDIAYGGIASGTPLR